MVNLFGQTEEVHSFSLEEIKKYVEKFDIHWQIKLYKHFSYIYPDLDHQLLTEAFDVAKMNGVVKQYQYLTFHLDIHPDSDMATYTDIYYSNEKFKQEGEARLAKSVGTPDNYRYALIIIIANI
ncbi:hypothetical protein RF11_10018 [Thelohanellus kitauei]|uniref:Uncharacterized protein n=1 Tax=Thelohanellus kitauei TaxID=669202 RepID=A0A0C2JSA1_THEKT|nr:hypothetical protein RF11_10018 [Thelohanellus kitauei]